eukprot:6921510-Pyramimonas_sp.AAC.1
MRQSDQGWAPAELPEAYDVVGGTTLSVGDVTELVSKFFKSCVNSAVAWTRAALPRGGRAAPVIDRCAASAYHCSRLLFFGRPGALSRASRQESYPALAGGQVARCG